MYTSRIYAHYLTVGWFRGIIDMLSSKMNGGEVNPVKKRDDVIKKAFPFAFDSTMDDIFTTLVLDTGRR
jgi:hypothetical protein